MHFLADRKRFENASKLAHSILEGCESRSFFTFLAGGFFVDCRRWEGAALGVVAVFRVLQAASQAETPSDVPSSRETSSRSTAR